MGGMVVGFYGTSMDSMELQHSVNPWLGADVDLRATCSVCTGPDQTPELGKTAQIQKEIIITLNKGLFITYCYIHIAGGGGGFVLRSFIGPGDGHANSTRLDYLPGSESPRPRFAAF
ncbi:unnamed protein product [Aspergillus oryzae]|nr:unnamed protein product [Aspergillus oryzae]